jgi:hypothetical protein
MVTGLKVWQAKLGIGILIGDPEQGLKVKMHYIHTHYYLSGLMRVSIVT